MKIICIGDSLTCGHKLIKRNSWPFMLEKEAKIEVVDKGIVGDTTFGMLARFYRDVIDEKPTYTIITGGTNDIVYKVPLPIIQSNLASMVFNAYHYNIIPVLGISIPTIPQKAKNNFKFTQDFEEVNEKIKENREWILNFASLVKCSAIDFYMEFYNKLTDQGKEEYYIDGVHPKTEGNKIMTKLVIKELGL